MPDAPLVLFVEDEPELRMLLVSILEQYGYRVAGANERATGAEIMRATRPALLIANVRLRGGNGDNLANIPVLLISGHPDSIREWEGGTIAFLQKPFKLFELEHKIEELIGRPSPPKKTRWLKSPRRTAAH